MELPCGLIGISPWTDLTGSGASYEEHKDIDPSMTKALLEFLRQVLHRRSHRPAVLAAVRRSDRGCRRLCCSPAATR